MTIREALESFNRELVIIGVTVDIDRPLSREDETLVVDAVNALMETLHQVKP